MTMRIAIGLTLLLATSLPAQTVPAGWRVVPDEAGGHDDGKGVSFVTMKPGYHVTTGPAVILFDTTMQARGNWRLEATIHLFDPGSRAEGFGVFFGGSALGSPHAAYSYALLRRDGKAMLKVRRGTETRTVRDWSQHAAIPRWTGGPDGTSVRYPLVVEAKGPRVTVWIGGTQVLDAPRSDVPSDGVVGLRINHALNVHVETLRVAPIAQ
jgi:hypothetical protein